MWWSGNGDPHRFPKNSSLYPPPPCISYADVRNDYGPYAHCSLDKAIACAQHIQLLAHTCACAWYDARVQKEKIAW